MKEFFSHLYFRLSALVVLPAFLLLAFDLLERRGDLPPLVALHLDAAGRLLDEQVPYIDFFDWANPFVFDLFTLPRFCFEPLSKLSLLLRMEDVVQGLILLAFFASISACLALLIKARASLNLDDSGAASPQSISQSAALAAELDLIALPYLVGLVFTGFFARYQLGDLQFLFVLSLAPWLLLRWLSYQRRAYQLPANNALDIQGNFALALGCFAALGSALDLPHCLALPAIEASLMAYYGKLKPPALRQWLGVLLGYFLVAMRFFTEPVVMQNAFWYWIVPLKMVHYQVFDANLYPAHSSPDQSRLFYLFFFAAAAWTIVGRRLSILTPLITLATVGLGFFLLEKEGFTRDALVMAFATIVMLSILLAKALASILPERKKLATALLSVVYLAFALTGFKYFDITWTDSMSPKSASLHAELPDVFQLLAKRLKSGSAVMVLADFPDAIYPLVANLDLRQSGYLLFARPMKVLNMLIDRGEVSGHWKTLYAHMAGKLNAEFQAGTNEIVLVHGDVVPEFLAKSGCQMALDSVYRPDGNCFYFSDNRSPREYIGFNHPYIVWVKKHK